MLTVVTRRLVQFAFVMFGVSVLTFLLIRLVPGDAAQIMLGTDGDADPARVDEMRTLIGLDRPLVAQYAAWIGRALHGDLGVSVWTGRPVLEELAQRAPVTIELTIGALAIAALLAVPLGCAMAAARRRWVVHLVQIVSIAGITMPSFWLATLLLYLTAAVAPGAAVLGFVPFGADPVANLARVALPVTALALPVIASLSRIVRAGMIEAMAQDYIRTARAKGLPERAIVFRHALRNALLPFLSGFGITAGYLFGGSIIIEQVFALPGLGRLMVGAIAERNYPLVQGGILLATLTFVTINAGVDLLYVVVDPRVRRR